MLRKTIASISILAGLTLTSCEHYVAQPNEQQKKYADDRSFCAGIAQQTPQNLAAFEQCMTSRGWPQGSAPQL
jgi:hypothetical protein